MIEEARSFEHSGPYFALLKWGSAAKQMVLYVIFIDVFVASWDCRPPSMPERLWPRSSRSSAKP